MIQSIVDALPGGFLPYVQTVLVIAAVIAVLMSFLCFFRLNSIIGTLIFVAIASGLWIVTPHIEDQVMIRQAKMHEAQIGTSPASQPQALPANHGSLPH